MTRTITQQVEIYKFGECPEVDENPLGSFHQSDFFGYFILEERLATLKELAKILNGRLDYCISLIADRGEYIKIIPKYDELDFNALWKVIDADKECPLTGCCYDHDIIDRLSKYNMEETLNIALDSYIEDIHNEYEDMLSDDYLKDYCEANEYEFTKNGEIY